MSDAAVETIRLSKDYGGGRGCRDVTLRVERGEAFGLLGPNGAGKSTFVKMLVGLIRPTGGRASLFGFPAGSLEARRRIGYLPELFRFPEWLTGEEVLRYHARLCELEGDRARSRIERLLEVVGIGRRGRDKIRHYSKGMQQRLGLACAMLNDPDLLILDEPASALDPVGRHEVRQILRRLREEGKTIFLNSHLLEDIEWLCDRVALLHRGEIVAEGALAEMLREKKRRYLRVAGFSPFLLDWLREESGVSVRIAADRPSPDGESVWLEAEAENDERIGRLHYLIVEQGMTLYESVPVSARLDEWFLKIVSGTKTPG